MKDLIFALIWFVVLGIYIFVSWKDAKSNNDVKKEITQMNELLLEQNTQLRKQNDHLNMVILSVCSKSVRDRQQKKDGKTNDETEKRETINHIGGKDHRGSYKINQCQCRNRPLNFKTPTLSDR